MGLSSGESSCFTGAASESDVSVEDRYFMLVEAVQDYAIFMLDPAGRVTSWNPGAQRIKGYTPEEIIGQHFSKFYTPEDIAAGKPARELETAAAVGRAEDEGWRVRRDGSRFWANVVVSAVHDASGALLGFAKVTRDMTERMRLAELERASQVSTHVQIARENEQKRIARELHDDLGQRLTALKMSVALLEAKLNKQADTEPLAAHTQELQKQIDWMAASLRRIAADLRPPLLDDLGLAAALDWLAEDFTKRYNVRSSVHLEPAEPVCGEFAATALFRIVQEALTNVARHAKARRVRIDMTCAGPIVSLDIEDDGVGVALDQPQGTSSFGLLGIRERVRQLRGNVSFTSSPGQGFRISIQIPADALV
ncbi:PAS domain S-box-containing protein [Paraburkholderia atlantica]|uniref:Oxygen sensor histidine kinase NreB n=1 Tax=Paraburkholderia atlantica TaxID=2654982 RepID=A0A7W8Q578_PARAM|nr:PAS domain-containing sensor histidine kinase [Paraburkholderia atlantica]MBB5423426.1 PAS domain S-box-containing protein [Paraburkholderia atlantica]